MRASFIDEDGKTLAGALALLRARRPLPHHGAHRVDQGVQVQNAAAQGLRGRVNTLFGEAQALHGAPDASGCAKSRLLSNILWKTVWKGSERWGKHATEGWP